MKNNTNNKKNITTRKPENTKKTIAEKWMRNEFESLMKQKTDSRREKITFIAWSKKQYQQWKTEWLIR